MTNEQLHEAVKRCLPNRDLMGALGELLSRSDSDAIESIRAAQDVELSIQTLQHNDRIRHYFRVASPEKDPFNV